MKTQRNILEMIAFSMNNQEILTNNQMKSLNGGDNLPIGQDPKIYIKE
ncbi:MAG: hypothetical protein HXX16_02085 [Bacteroidales bacterium]|nr:hypothetical protein [Bacteroidales bacterium]